MDKLLLVDGNSLINRAYYATSLTNGATYGFLNMLLRAIQDLSVTHVAIAFDVRAKTFRHEMYDGYKSHRKGMPDDLATQFTDLKNLLSIMKITMLEKVGFEADDIIGTVSEQLSKTGQCKTIILSADRDGLQLVNENTELHLTKTGVTHLEIYTPDRIRKEYNLEPQQFIDLKALMGDKSDNIPGAQGIGEKTALALMHEFGTLENILNNTINPKILTQKDMINLSKKLAKINCDVPIEYSFNDFELKMPFSKEVYNAFKTRNFHSLCNRKNLWPEEANDEINDDKSASTSPKQISFLDAIPKQNKPSSEPLSHAQKIDNDLTPILIKMSHTGVKIDLVTLQELSLKYEKTIVEISARIYELTGQQFNINSPKQLGDILYTKLGIEVTKKTKTGLSTNEAVLQKIEKMHPVIPEIMRYRKVHKIYSTYIQGLQNHVDDNGLIHSNFQNNTSTGRLTSSEPNLQNLPRDSNEIHSLFISRFDNGKILTADYSQIELRILAHLSKDQTMQTAFKTKKDIHEETATALGIDRRTAKAVNFGITYGQTAFGLAETLSVPVPDATRFIDNYFARFPNIKKFLNDCRDFAITHGYIETMFGRRRDIPELSSRNHHLVGFGTRAAINMPMQGAAADIIKKAMIEIDSELTEKKLKSIMVNQIHDELVFDVHPDEIELVKNLVKEKMENIVTLDVPLVVDIDINDTL